MKAKHELFRKIKKRTMRKRHKMGEKRENINEEERETKRYKDELVRQELIKEKEKWTRKRC